MKFKILQRHHTFILPLISYSDSGKSLTQTHPEQLFTGQSILSACYEREESNTDTKQSLWLCLHSCNILCGLPDEVCSLPWSTWSSDGWRACRRLSWMGDAGRGEQRWMVRSPDVSFRQRNPLGKPLRVGFLMQWGEKKVFTYSCSISHILMRLYVHYWIAWISYTISDITLSVFYFHEDSLS